MSAALAYPRPTWQAQPRHIEIVTTRAQRRARPTSFYAVVSVVTVFALLMVQLLLSILLSDGAYQISALQAEQKQLMRVEQSLAERLDLLASPQSLAIKAEDLGMVLGTTAPAFLQLSDGLLFGTPIAASGRTGAVGSGGGLVANALLSSLDQAGRPTTRDASGGAPAQSSASGSVASNSEGLPSPVTR